MRPCSEANIATSEAVKSYPLQSTPYRFLPTRKQVVEILVEATECMDPEVGRAYGTHFTRSASRNKLKAPEVGLERMSTSTYN
jgi:hypothetical protein